MTRVGDSDQRAHYLMTMDIVHELYGWNKAITRRPGITRIRNVMQMVKHAPKNQPFSLYYTVQKRFYKNSEDAATRLRFTQSLYMNSFIQARVGIIFHVNSSRGLFEFTPCPSLIHSNQADCHISFLHNFLHFVTSHSKPVATIVSSFWKNSMPIAAVSSLLTAYFDLLNSALSTPSTTPDPFISYSIRVLLAGLSIMKTNTITVLLRNPTLLCHLLRAIDTVERRGSELLTNWELEAVHVSISRLVTLFATEKSCLPL